MLIDITHKNKTFLESSIIECKGVLRPKTLGNCCPSRSWGTLVSESSPSRHCPHCLLPSPLPHPPPRAPPLSPPGMPTRAQMELSIRLSLPALPVCAFLQKGVSVCVPGRSCVVQQGYPLAVCGTDRSDCRIGFAAVAAAGKECLLLAWAQALPTPMGSPPGLP